MSSEPLPPAPAPEEAPRPHRRRPRYAGKHPRRFADKYKEHRGDPETAAKVEASGKTLAGTHRSIMVAEVLEALQPQPGEIGVDCTLGYGGHARALLERLGPGGCLLGLDADPLQLPRAEARLRTAGFGPERFRARLTNFAGVRKALAAEGLPGADFLLADLGLSSMQIDDPTRGFSVREDGPLDMRLNPQRGLTAGQWLERISIPKLALALREHADEPAAEHLAAALAGRTFSGTHALAQAVREALPAGLDREEVATTIRRVFQAVRIAVNEEFSVLEALLRCLPEVLRPGGRVAILSFHSGEDRRVKKAFQLGQRAGIYSAVSDLIRPTPEECRANSRAAPAKLRWAKRTD
ncbi:MAG: 16S rRNA (cytosine(1402)-N(4))-methyltransferase RsmH [Verrucomicrobia bacterium]|nr:16S rRNA (cytosine(1402)-N(4))-methyltransferase RsmH [Verrucomicrobiota bacterium]